MAIGVSFQQRSAPWNSGSIPLPQTTENPFGVAIAVLIPCYNEEVAIETVHALQLRMPVSEVPVPYKDRPSGSTSKLRTFRDGFRILRTILVLIKEERPLQFFCSIFALLALLSTMLALPIFSEYLKTGLVPRLPTAVLSTGAMVLAFLSLACGLILDTVTLGRREMKRMFYLAIPAPGVCALQPPLTSPTAPQS